MNNISMVTFGAKEQSGLYDVDIPEFVRNRKAQRQTSEYNEKQNEETDAGYKKMERTPAQDEYRPHQVRTQKKNHGILKAAAAFAAGVATAFSINSATTPHPASEITIPFDSNTTSINEVAELYGVDENVVKLNNEIYELEDLSEVTTLDIPTEYDYVQDEIEEKQTELYSEKLTDEKRSALETEIEVLQRKHDLQQQIATAYTDGEYVYFSINDLSATSDYENGISLEEFRKLFDIKKKAIQNNNSLENVDWTVSANSGSVDFDNYLLRSGKTIKVKQSDIKKNNIDVTDFE